MLNTVHGSRTIAPEENFPTALTETLTLAQTLVITGGGGGGGGFEHVFVWVMDYNIV